MYMYVRVFQAMVLEYLDQQIMSPREAEPPTLNDDAGTARLPDTAFGAAAFSTAGDATDETHVLQLTRENVLKHEQYQRYRSIATFVYSFDCALHETE